MPGIKNGAADALSRRGKALDDSDVEDGDTANDYFKSKLYAISADRMEPDYTAQVWVIRNEYTGDDLLLAQYLESLQRPEGLSDTQYQQLRKKSWNFLVRDGYLFKRARKSGVPPRRVLGKPDDRTDAIRQLHDEAGHRGTHVTYDHVAR